MTTTQLYYNYNFSIWFNDKDSQKQELKTEEIKKIIENLTAKMLGFWTVTYNHKWIWTYENWKTGVEQSAIVNWKTDSMNSELVDKFTSTLKKALNQESILVACTRERVNFA